ncbi:hypothetical protein HNQ93_002547 [Hymenobacter luteus]|uniref:PD-(D/E)XK nuclease superfamily protein n=2 Tax=Hymenobacter TaxID=89966 RepID=A0A7W9T147_9BACT|nr:MULTISPECIES: PD-(D/E)XK nuclease family protein [Hymenobacter]MBB4601884.1 hypothetical protein [Hymenobacter latericoloratus]MBB6059687.1 hypothetical protein [Hymenobacter luteus]
MKPNIFQYATKELSQDAFIAWLLDWANPGNLIHDKDLHHCALDFVQMLLGTEGKQQQLIIQSVAVELQWKKIDVTAEIVTTEGRYLLVIEDKIHSAEHSEQLTNYQKIAADRCQTTGCELRCVYLKTGNESSNTLKNVRAKGFRIVSRKQIIGMLSEHTNVQNHILQDYKSRLELIEKTFREFEDKQIGIQHWHPSDWVGLFTMLDENEAIIRWHYVANPAGGFQNALLNWHGWRGVCVYAQLEEEKLCYKISFNPEDAEVDLEALDLDKIQDTWQSVLLKNAQKSTDASIQAIRRPNRYVHKGTWRTVAIVDRQNWLGKDGELVDVQQVINNLNAHKKFIKDCLKSESFNV